MDFGGFSKEQIGRNLIQSYSLVACVVGCFEKHVNTPPMLVIDYNNKIF